MRKVLVITGDDFGSSLHANERILTAHLRGILTSTSLMVNETAAGEAAALAGDTPTLDVGLHLTLSDGHAALTPEQAPQLVDAQGRFRASPARAGLAYWFRPSLRRQVQDEIKAQFDRFAMTGLPCSHVDGHQHLHVHPVIWDAVVHRCIEHHVSWVRVPFEEWLPCGNVPAARRMEWVAMRMLSRRCRRKAEARGIHCADRVYGHVNSGRMTVQCLQTTIRHQSGSINEIYLHPGASDGEFEAATAPVVKETIAELQIALVSFANLLSE